MRIDLEALDALAKKANGSVFTFPVGINPSLAEFIVKVVCAYPSLAARIRELEAENERLRECLTECADDLEAEIMAKANAQLSRTTKRDLAPVVKARALLEKGEG